MSKISLTVPMRNVSAGSKHPRTRSTQADKGAETRSCDALQDQADLGAVPRCVKRPLDPAEAL